MSKQHAHNIVITLQQAGHVALFAGGCVRDSLLGLEPKDFDVATSALPNEVQALFPESKFVGKAFGVSIHNGVEIATFRVEAGFTDGRHPDEVKFVRNPEDDAKRRDLTINGLFFDPIKNEVLDFVGGQEDLRNGVIRAIGNPDERFAEDFLRILRAVRFATKFGFTFDSKTFDSVKRNAHQLLNLPKERIGGEVRKIVANNPRGLWWLDISGITKVLLGIDPERHRDAVLDFHRADFATVCGLLLDIHLDLNLNTLRERFDLTADEVKQLKELPDLIEFARAFNGLPLAKQKRLWANPNFHRAILIVEAVDEDGLVWESRENVFSTELPPRIITGKTLLSVGGIDKRAFTGLLEDAFDAQLEGRLNVDNAPQFLADMLKPEHFVKA